MKNFYLLIVGFLVSFQVIQSQELNYSIGLKGGANYAMGGEIRGSKSASTYWGGTVQGEGALGFHGGAFFEIGFGRFFLRPEVVYSSLEQEFQIPLREDNTVFSVETFTVPLLVGINVYGPVDIYAGPVYSNILSTNLEGLEDQDREIVVQSTPINAQAGIKAEFGRFGLDVRYEHSLSTEERQNLSFDNNYFGGPIGGANKGWFNDARLNQVIVSLTFKIFGSGLNEGRRRGGGCYF